MCPWLLVVALAAPADASEGQAVAAQGTPAGRPADIAFRVQMIDPGVSESVAVADFNRDGRLDILSAEAWYEAPRWTKHRIREIPFTGGYVDNFSDLPVDVDGDGYTDIVQIAYFARRIVWLKNPGKGRGPWVETEIDPVGPTEFAFLVDLNNDGKALELLPQFTGAGKAPLTWYELVDRAWVKHAVSAQSHGQRRMDPPPRGLRGPRRRWASDGRGRHRRRRRPRRGDGGKDGPVRVREPDQDAESACGPSEARSRRARASGGGAPRALRNADARVSGATL